ncbi:unnamed protein product, partial [Ceratitis capitata]
MEEQLLFLGHQSLRKSSSHDEKRKNFDRELVDGVLIAVLISSGVAYELLSCGVNVRGFDARPGAYYFGSVMIRAMHTEDAIAAVEHSIEKNTAIPRIIEPLPIQFYLRSDHQMRRTFVESNLKSKSPKDV